MPVADSPIRDRTWVADRLADGATVTAIAQEAGVSRQTAQAWLARHGLRVPARAKPRPPVSRLRALYERHGNVAAVAEALAVAPSTAHRWLIDAGIQFPGPGRKRRLADSRELTELRHRRKAGATHRELAEQFGVSVSTVRRRLEES